MIKHSVDKTNGHSDDIYHSPYPLTCHFTVRDSKQLWLELCWMDLTNKRPVKSEALDAGILSVGNTHFMSTLQNSDAVWNVEG